MAATEADQAAFAAAHAQHAQLVDVREPDEYRGGHIPGALNIPLGALAARSSELDATTPVYVICQSGGRSAKGAEALTLAGFQALSVAGGTADWVTAGRPTITGDQPTATP